MRKKINKFENAVKKNLDTEKLITVLTGAGISAESNIPTFRGPEGYWTIGSKNYKPSEIATQVMLSQNPEEVWKWFLFRRGVCMNAVPNKGHTAIAEMEKLLGHKFLLVTQNVDGLHIRAGNSLGRTYQVHGNLNYMRCHKECTQALYTIPEKIPSKDRGQDLLTAEWDMLKCPNCGAFTRPHVLLWDELYNEEHYKFESSLRAAGKTSLLIVVGTTGSTNLPNHFVTTVLKCGGTIFDVNIEKNIFSQAADQSNGGTFFQGSSGEIIPILFETIKSNMLL